MAYRIQEILRMIIPGLYLLSMILILFLIGGGWNTMATKDQDTIIDVLKGASNVVVLLLPFLGFVVGYMIECTMSFGERLLYIVGLRRPSKVVLDGCKMYSLNNIRDIKKALAVKAPITNHMADQTLQKTKQMIQRQTVEMFHDTSIMSRNLMGSQLILVAFTAFYLNVLSAEFFAMLGMFVLLSIYWYHKNCIYVKYVFSEYGKILTAKNDNTKFGK